MLRDKSAHYSFFTQSHILGDLGNEHKYPLTHFEYLVVRVNPKFTQVCGRPLNLSMVRDTATATDIATATTTPTATAKDPPTTIFPTMQIRLDCQIEIFVFRNKAI